ncbi:hypothetical protein BS50DRAFT_331767 [Corynespora cassiicola Philippines]|uniref:Uncharacterized protein n=1 Tax=Corynespora cassiicola Philippines TaxID=1448308 RepID=A0A2T2NUM2_CORCC|nr:hypothetical protein BS50DRAFT_331767 [Corynespora cassiicola Philippines]
MPGQMDGTALVVVMMSYQVRCASDPCVHTSRVAEVSSSMERGQWHPGSLLARAWLHGCPRTKPSATYCMR